MRVLVTGATGFIGRHVVGALTARGDDVVALARSTSRAWKVERLKALGATVAFGDVTDPESLVAPMKDVDAVVHAAAVVQFGKVDAKAMARINVDGTRHVMDMARRLDVAKVLHVSSIAALGIHADGTVDETAVHPRDYASAYERTKHEASLVADEAARRGLHVVQALPSVVFGPRDPNFGVFFKRWMRRKVPVLPGPETVLSLVHVEDLARGIVQALDEGGAGDKYLFTQANITLRDLFTLIEAASGVRGPRLVVPSRVARGFVKVAAVAATPTPWRGMVSRRSGDVLGKRRVYLNDTAVARLGWDPGDFEARLAGVSRWYARYYAGRAGGPPPVEGDGADPAVDATTLERPVPRLVDGEVVVDPDGTARPRATAAPRAD